MSIKPLTCHQMLRAGEDGAAANKHTPQRSTQLNNCVGNNSVWNCLDKRLQIVYLVFQQIQEVKESPLSVHSVNNTF